MSATTEVVREFPAPDRETHARRVSGPGAGVAPLPTALAAAADAADLVDHLAAIPTGRRAGVLAALLLVPGLPAAWLVLSAFLDVPGRLGAAGGSFPLQLAVVAGPVVVVLSVAVAGWLRLNRRPNPVLHLFGNGALLVRRGHADPQVLPRAALGPCEWGLGQRVGESPVPVGSSGLAVRDQGGRRLLAVGGPAIEELAATAAEVELPRARAELLAGHPVRYGPVVLTTAGLRVGDRELGWAAIGLLTLTGRHVVVYGAGPEAPLLARVARRQTPHQRVLLVLAGERIAVARQSG